MSINETKCPNCGAPINPRLYRCPYCETPYPDAEIVTFWVDNVPVETVVKGDPAKAAAEWLNEHPEATEQLAACADEIAESTLTFGSAARALGGGLMDIFRSLAQAFKDIFTTDIFSQEAA